jgi:hypothetical protein
MKIFFNCLVHTNNNIVEDMIFNIKKFVDQPIICLHVSKVFEDFDFERFSRIENVYINPDRYNTYKGGTFMTPLCSNINYITNVLKLDYDYQMIFYSQMLFIKKGVENYLKGFDIDPECESIADMINNNYVFKEWKFKAHTADCNTFISDADLIINTSSEHFETMDWFDNIKLGTRVIIQGNDMDHDDHVVHSDSLEKFIKQYPLSEIDYQGELEFVYPDWSFNRYMLIGKK